MHQFSGDKKTRLLTAIYTKIMHSCGFLSEYVMNLLHNGLLPILKKQVESMSHLHHFYPQKQMYLYKILQKHSMHFTLSER